MIQLSIVQFDKLVEQYRMLRAHVLAATAELRAENDRLKKLGQEKIDRLEAEVKRLRAALEASHVHVFAKPGCVACEVLDLPGFERNGVFKEEETDIPEPFL